MKNKENIISTCLEYHSYIQEVNDELLNEFEPKIDKLLSENKLKEAAKLLKSFDTTKINDISIFEGYSILLKKVFDAKMKFERKERIKKIIINDEFFSELSNHLDSKIVEDNLEELIDKIYSFTKLYV